MSKKVIQKEKKYCLIFKFKHFLLFDFRINEIHRFDF